MAKRKPTKIVQTGTRMPESLRVKLEKVAKTAGVSLNAEIVRRLERSFEWESLSQAVLSEAKEYRAQTFEALAEMAKEMLRSKESDK